MEDTQTVERHALCPTYDHAIEGTKMVSMVIDGPTVSFSESEQTEEGWASSGEDYDAYSVEAELPDIEDLPDEQWRDHFEPLYLAQQARQKPSYWVKLRSSTDGVDCDGRLSSDRTMIVRLKLAYTMQCPGRPDQEIWLPEQDDRGHPDWQTQSDTRRDYNAEAAGY
jgi:hypothetical protein